MPVDAIMGEDTIIHHPELVNIYGCRIGERCSIGCFVEIGKGVIIGNDCSIQSNVYIPKGVTIGNNVFMGPGVTFLNDKRPPSYGKHWRNTIVEDHVSIGGGAVILPGVTLREGCLIGAGAVVTKNVDEREIVIGVPARALASR